MENHKMEGKRWILKTPKTKTKKKQKKKKEKKKKERKRNKKFVIIYVYAVEEKQRREERHTSKIKCREISHWTHRLGENHRGKLERKKLKAIIGSWGKWTVEKFKKLSTENWKTTRKLRVAQSGALNSPLSGHTTWPQHTQRHHYTINAEGNPKRHKKNKK